MGWSCTAKAADTLDRIREDKRFDDINNKEYRFFIEVGRENDDGSITGTIGEVFGPSKENGARTCKMIGSIKIDRNGMIVRLPGIPKKEWSFFEKKPMFEVIS